MAAQGVSVAFLDDIFEENPVFTRIDSDYRVVEWSIARGRSYERDRTTTGTASVTLMDTTGDLDPTNTGAAFYGSMLPLKQAAIGLQHPGTSAWSTVFRGYVSRWRVQPHVTEDYLLVTIDMVDALDILEAWQLVAGAGVGTATSQNDVSFPADSSLTAMQTRINAVLDSIGFPIGLREIFTGNVGLKEAVYAPRDTVLSVILDAVDAEFPGGVANAWVAKDGKFTVHGRFARFNYSDPQYHINQWELGDRTAADASPSTVVRVSPPVSYGLDTGSLFTAGFATPQNIGDADIDGQYVEDTGAAAAYGTRTWSAENLLTANGSGPTTALAETLLFADYAKDNYAQPLLRVDTLTVKSQDTGGAYGDATWDFLTGVDISDYVTVTTAHVGGGGLGFTGFVEGLRYTATPLTATHPYVELEVDVSPAGHYDANPFV